MIGTDQSLAAATAATTIVRTERGLTISGTRTTLYRVCECIDQGWPQELVREWLGLTEEQLAVALHYLNAHSEEVRQEYQDVIRDAEDTRRHWEERNRGRLEAVATKKTRPDVQALREKIRLERERGLKSR